MKFGVEYTPADGRKAEVINALGYGFDGEWIVFFDGLTADGGQVYSVRSRDVKSIRRLEEKAR